ncbi:allergen Asp F7 [Paecilomyces variotii No. 5]|uniref:Allergen Asp F7 n=1 Tax=Byssochlamys spectabilis (strain No. 5 / NBRC 109023) TaxID=1356009 RepID=V5GFQ9_BYSSN|nr:allergen Asp F7 [Paecilomyces variotii No. 5]
MAPISKSVALAGALFSVLSTAVPMNKRAVVWETVTDVVWTTVDTTVTITPGQTSFSIPTPSGAGHFVELTAASEASSTPVASSSSPAAAPVQTVAAVQAPQQESSSAAPAPTASSIVTPAPQPTAASASSSAPAPSSSASSGSSGYSGQCSESSPCSGDGTYYDTATSMTNPSSCGTANDGLTENVLALPVGMMSEKYCGKTVTVNYNGKTAQGTVVDKCMGCEGDSIDLSRHFFGALADLSEGRLSDVKWYIN